VPHEDDNEDNASPKNFKGDYKSSEILICGR